MRYLKTYEERLNEEFVGGLIKGALGKLMGAFSNAFKDIIDDFKKDFLPDDPNSVKNIVLKNFNQAVDSAQKELVKVDEAGIMTIMTNMIGDAKAKTGLIGLANGIGSDIEKAIGKNEAKAPAVIAKAVLLGNKEAKWAGIVGLLDPNKGQAGIKTKYKYSANAYLQEIAKGGDLKAKVALATKFLDLMQKDIAQQVAKEFSEEEIKSLYDKIKGGKAESDITFEQIKEWFDKDIEVIYLLKDKKKEDATSKILKNPKAEDQDIVRVGVIDEINDANKTLVEDEWIARFKTADNKIAEKTINDIIGKFESKSVSNAKEALGKIKGDSNAMQTITKMAEVLADPKANADTITKVKEIIK